MEEGGGYAHYTGSGTMSLPGSYVPNYFGKGWGSGRGGAPLSSLNGSRAFNYTFTQTPRHPRQTMPSPTQGNDPKPATNVRRPTYFQNMAQQVVGQTRTKSTRKRL